MMLLAVVFIERALSMGRSDAISKKNIFRESKIDLLFNLQDLGHDVAPVRLCDGFELLFSLYVAATVFQMAHVGFLKLWLCLIQVLLVDVRVA